MAGPWQFVADSTTVPVVTAAEEADYVLLRRESGYKQITVANLLKSCLRVANTLSATLQTITVGGTATALAVATTKVQVGTDEAAHFVGFFGATPAAKQSTGVIGVGYDLSQVGGALANLGLGEQTP